MPYSLELELDLLRYLLSPSTSNTSTFGLYATELSSLFKANEVVQIFVREVEFYFKQYKKIPTLQECKVLFDKYLNIKEKDGSLSVFSQNLQSLLEFLYSPFYTNNTELYESKLKMLRSYNYVNKAHEELTLLLQDIYQYEDSIENIKDIFRRCLFTLEGVSDKDVESIEFLELIQNKSLLESEIANKISTGIKILDKYLNGGLSRKSIGFVEAKPGYGKSNFLLNLALNAYLSGYNVCYVSNELFFEDVQKRLLSRYFGVSLSTLTGSVYENYTQRLQELSNRKNYFDISYWVPSKLTVTALAGYLDKLSIRNGGKYPDILVLDYFDRMSFKSPTNKNLWQVQTESIRELLSIASEHNFALWSATQPIKEAYDDKTLKLGSIGGSRTKVEDASVILTLNDVDDVTDTTRVVISKNRRGPSPVYVNLLYKPEYCLFTDIPGQDNGLYFSSDQGRNGTPITLNGHNKSIQSNFETTITDIQQTPSNDIPF
jgi:replicative DNA helicase